MRADDSSLGISFIAKFSIEFIPKLTLQCWDSSSIILIAALSHSVKVAASFGKLENLLLDSILSSSILSFFKSSTLSCSFEGILGGYVLSLEPF